MGVEATCDGDVGVAQHVGDDSKFLTPFEHQRGEGMAHVVETTIFQAGLPKELVELPVHVRRGERGPRLGYEHKVVGLEFGSASQEQLPRRNA